MAKKKATPEPTQPKGWIPKRQTRRITPDGAYWEPDDGAETLWADISRGLSFDECAALPYGDEVTFDEIHPAIAPYVVDWNVCGRNVVTREWERLPPPAEAGPDVFRAIDRFIVLWLLHELKFGPLPVGDQKKESTATDATDGG